MNDVATTFSGDVAVFDPVKTRERNAFADAAIQYAKQVKDWTLLEEAVRRKLLEQADFVAWWEENVSARHRPGRSGTKELSTGHATIPMREAEEQTGIRNEQVSRWRRRLTDPDKYRDLLYGRIYAEAMAEKSSTTAAKWTGDPESYTPIEYIAAARAALGGIDLDPASNAFAQETVDAGRYFDETADGLKQAWQGCVFLNPPYKYPTIAHFVAKLIDEFSAGQVSAAILLTNNNTDARWWQDAARAATAVCFTAGRINFYKASGEITQPTNGQSFFYFGPDRDRFVDAFAKVGVIMVVAP